MAKIGIMTSIETNHGSCVFNTSLYNLIKSLNLENSVQLVDFINSKSQLRELLRSLKIHKKIPFYNLQRAITLSRYNISATPIHYLNSLKSYENTCEELASSKYSTLIVAKVMWDISNNSKYKFPNAFWLSNKIHVPKIAYAISGHRTDLEVFRKYKKQVLDILSSYQLIGVRDNMTQVMMEEAGVNKVTPVFRLSDPAFLFEPKHIEPETLLKRYKISANRPLLGLLYYGKDSISVNICEHYCVIRSMAASESGASRPPNPEHVDH
jgi:Polysaccharide pyruvyl transferase